MLTPLQWLWPLAWSPIHFGGSVAELMLESAVGVVRANIAVLFGEREVATELPTTGAEAELELVRAKPELAETAGEQRVPRGVTAG